MSNPNKTPPTPNSIPHPNSNPNANANAAHLSNNNSNLGEDDDDLDDLDEVLDQFSSPPLSSMPASIPGPAPKQLTPTSIPSIPSAPPPTATLPPSTFTDSPSPGPNPSSENEDTEGDLTEAFTRELQREMESLMRDMISGSLSGSGGDNGSEAQSGTIASPDVVTKEQERAFKAAWEALLVHDMDQMGMSGGEEFVPRPVPPSASFPPSSATSSSSIPHGEGKAEGDPISRPAADFQSGIRAAMDKLKSSESGFKSPSPSQSITATTSATNQQYPSDPFEAFLTQLAAIDPGSSNGARDHSAGTVQGEQAEAKVGEGGDECEDEEELRTLLESMMESLMSKNVLYEPLKELGEKYPTYLATNAHTLPPADKVRYETQLGYIRRIVGIFEDPEYDSQVKDKEGSEKSAEVVELMGLMQQCGSPPTELIGDLPPGFVLGPDGMPAMPEGCCIS